MKSLIKVTKMKQKEVRMPIEIYYITTGMFL